MKTRLPTSQLIISLLNSSSFHKNAAEYALAKRPCFALLKIGGEVVEDELDTLAQTCAFLNDVGLLPAIVHGGGPQMNKELAKRGVKPSYVKGNRVTDEATLKVAVSVFTELNERVTSALKKAGAPARGLPSGVFRSKISSPELGLVGEVVGVEVSKVQDALAAKEIPVLTSLGFSSSEPNLNINADVAARELALAIQPNRVVYTSAKGGWVDDDTKKIVPKIVMARDYARLASLNYEGRQGTLLKLNEIKALLDGLPDDAAVTIANAGGILTELFSPQGTGSGTTFTKSDKSAKVIRFDSIGAVDLGRLSRLFPKEATSSDLLARYQNREAVVLADADNYSCAAITSKSPAGGYVVEQLSAPASASGALKENLLSEFKGGLAWKVTDTASDSLLSQATGLTKVNDQQIAWFGADWNEQKAKAFALESPAAGSEVPPASRWTAPIANKSSVARKRDVKVGLLGARGYVGREVVKLIAQHPRLELALASSRALVGKSVAKEFNVTDGIDPSFKFETVEGADVEGHPRAREIDVWVLALPNGLAPKWIDPLTKVGKNANNGTGALMIDLGADFRFTDEWTYGLPERKGAREKIKGARKIANPGCYATGAQVSIMPLVHHRLVADIPTVFGLSGYSGAGTTPSDKNNPLSLRDNVIPYTLVKHMHEREVSRHCDQRIAFMPHVAPYFQGIALTTSVHLNKDFAGAKDFVAMFQEFYQGEPLIKVFPGEAPRVRDNMTQHHVAVGGFTWDDKNRRLAMHATIDNLLKGAATQAVQNINIALGFDELAGINLPSK